MFSIPQRAFLDNEEGPNWGSIQEEAQERKSVSISHADQTYLGGWSCKEKGTQEKLREWCWKCLRYVCRNILKAVVEN